MEWAIEHGNDIAIAYACSVEDFPLPDGWTASRQHTLTGARKASRKARDLVYFSPGCLAA